MLDLVNSIVSLFHRSIYINFSANDSNLAEAGLACEFDDFLNPGVRNCSVDLADDEDFVALKQIPLCDITPGRIRIMESWSKR